jgi:YrbI family 3-deoxy-D-manno-octulosonate 8-phosphate phosphatase
VEIPREDTSSSALTPTSTECLAVIPAPSATGLLAAEMAGMPVLAHAIAATRAASRITRIVVATDGEELAAIGHAQGVEVVRQPLAQADRALGYTLQLLREDAYAPAIVVLVSPSAPLTTPVDINGAIEALERCGAGHSFTATPITGSLWRRHESARDASGASSVAARHDEPELLYEETGAVHALDAAQFVEVGHRYCGKAAMHIVPRERRLEVQSPRDLALAEAGLRALPRASVATDRLPARVEALVLDFDGVLTDNRVLVTDDGHEAVLCNRGDGMGLGLLQAKGIKLLFLSKERNPVVSRRAEKLRIECLQAIDDKPTALRRWAADNHVDLANAVFIGNDINDVGCMQIVGCAACPADSHPTALAAAQLVLTKNGGEGAVRELCDLLLAHPSAASPLSEAPG